MATYTPIQSVVLSTTATQVLFSNIPQDYTDIVIRSSYKSTADDLPFIRFASNGAIDAGTNYGYRYLRGNGSTAAGGGASGANQIYVGYSNTGQSNFHIHINGYSNTTLNKVTLSKGDDATNNGTYVYVGEWRNTGAITHVSVNIGNSGASFQAGSTFDLYGIKSGAPQALGGDLVTTDGNYWYHTFRSTQTFTPLRNLTCDYLVVAGGGGSGDNGGGGGGGGGLRSTVTATGGGGALESAISVTSQAYTIQVGAGGNAGISGSTPTSGTASIFSTITSAGGGYGGGYLSGTGAQSGGSGGSGGGGNGNGNNPGGAASPSGQGYAGGAGVPAPAGYYRTSGGGGGAGAAGTNGTGSGKTGGNGGNGIYTALSNAVTAGQLSGGNYYLSGGGGGVGESGAGTSGLGGAGTPSINSTGGNGTANTGGGAGGAGGSGGNGGSGIVIVRYAV